MLAKKLRVPIQSFPRNAKVVFSDTYITIKSVANGLLTDRLSVLVNKQVSKKSVDRNFLKRKVSNSFKEFLNKKGGRDLLIILKPPIIRLTKKELTDTLRKYEHLI